MCTALYREQDSEELKHSEIQQNITVRREEWPGKREGEKYVVKSDYRSIFQRTRFFSKRGHVEVGFERAKSAGVASCIC